MVLMYKYVLLEDKYVALFYDKPTACNSSKEKEEKW